MGERARWFDDALGAPRSILLPFSWGAPLSGVRDSADIGWYQRSITAPERWAGKRVFLSHTEVRQSDAPIDGVKMGEHQGGYTPFSIELTTVIASPTPNNVARSRARGATSQRRRPVKTAAGSCASCSRRRWNGMR